MGGGWPDRALGLEKKAQGPGCHTLTDGLHQTNAFVHSRGDVSKEGARRGKQGRKSAEGRRSAKQVQSTWGRRGRLTVCQDFLG